MEESPIYTPVDRDTAISLVDAVRRALPGVDAVTGLRACRQLRELRNDERSAQVRRAYMADGRPGEAADYGASPVPDAYHGSKSHEVTAKRSNSGRTAITVRRYGTAHVQGVTAFGPHVCELPEVFAPSTDDVTVHPGLLKRQLDQTRRTNVGRDALAVTRLTDAAYGPLGVPALLGTDVRAFAEIVTPTEDDTLSSPVARHRSTIGAWLSTGVLDEIATHTAVYGAHTAGVTRWPTRTRLTTPKVRRSEASRLAPRVQTIDGQPFTVTPLLAPTGEVERAFYGHRADTRPDTTHQARRRKRADRTIGTVDAPTAETGWTELLDHLNRGERLQVRRGDNVVATITRAKSGRYSATLADGLAIAKGSRTTLAAARKLAAAIG